MGQQLSEKVGDLGFLAGGEGTDSKGCEWFEDETVLQTADKDEIECVKALRAEVDTRFDPEEIKDHERLMADLWVLFTGDRDSFKLKSKRWTEFGFQCEDAHTDIRGGGKLAVENLKYFLAHYPDSAMGLMRRQNHIMQLHWRENWYPFSVVGVHVTDMVCRVFGVYRRSFGGDVSKQTSWRLRNLRPCDLWPMLVNAETDPSSFFGAEKAPSPPKWQRGFAEVYCVAFMLLDRNFVRHNASYFDFRHVIQVTEQELTEALHEHKDKSLTRIKPYLSIYPRAVPPPAPTGPRPPMGTGKRIYSNVFSRSKAASRRSDANRNGAASGAREPPTKTSTTTTSTTTTSTTTTTTTASTATTASTQSSSSHASHPLDIDPRAHKWMVYSKSGVYAREQPTTFSKPKAVLQYKEEIDGLELKGGWLRHKKGWSLLRKHDGTILLGISEAGLDEEEQGACRSGKDSSVKGGKAVDDEGDGGAVRRGGVGVFFGQGSSFEQKTNRGRQQHQQQSHHNKQRQQHGDGVESRKEQPGDGAQHSLAGKLSAGSGKASVVAPSGKGQDVRHKQSGAAGAIDDGNAAALDKTLENDVDNGSSVYLSDEFVLV
uniref:ELMO domain-containing protein n=2 Tax=Lotharella globosa TaxID=91324 RepID=A0A7S3YN95_9EUKA|mmetsp:Transcript_14104/g.28502  ORF Transcript_14104/g.28502 Transcript_14104/m.28502 type:complete len:600 (-) Transcript_14104:181-1980(-)|eukprot:CAMPEP_0167790592 /NCGR_PEP_ID=MMETSP0111_2-20121227/11424_1 /TAXON_ID=91324 /ORGANISM="Lotharella globosa, Strain CCCM811" /LENGTH=599 /DNA_ID=CAMNT_0007683083 /DNA_START=15 /DNA_END=1814 /DNA_ORIENTATION=-